MLKFTENEVCESGEETLFFDKCNSVHSTINVVVFWKKKNYKCFMVYFPFQITDSYIYISFL